MVKSKHLGLAKSYGQGNKKLAQTLTLTRALTRTLTRTQLISAQKCSYRERL